MKLPLLESLYIESWQMDDGPVSKTDEEFVRRQYEASVALVY